MKCPNCGFSFTEGCICPDCGVDIYIYRKARNASIRLYNKGLAYAKERDLSAAVNCLEQSLIFDKGNTHARNLLGLIYCEMGRLPEALKHWIISSNQLPQNNPAIGYMEFMQKNGREMETCNDAVHMYNQALRYLRQGSDDLAVIQLKKSIDSNPDLIEAYNLMTLCCIAEKNYKRALHFNDIVLKKDVKNPTALHYAALLGSAPTAPILSAAQKQEKKKVVSVKRTDSNPDLPRYKRKEKQTNLIGKRDLIVSAASILCTLIVMLVLVMPAISDAKDQKIAELETQLEDFQGTTNMTAEEVANMRDQLNALESENNQLRSEENLQKNLDALQNAVDLLAAGDYEACVTTLSDIDTSQFNEEQLSSYRSLRATAYPEAANSYYTQGKSDFLSNNYADAKPNLENALKYANGENFVDDSYYYLAKIAEADGDIETAISYYTKVIQEYPDSNQLSNAQNALAQLQ